MGSRDRGAAVAVSAVVLGSVGAALAAIVALGSDGPLALDRLVADHLTARDGWRQVAVLATQLGAGPVVYPVLALVCALTIDPTRRWRWRTYLPVALLAAAQLLEVVLTAPFVRIGPDGADPLSTSLSSGHATAAVVGWGLAAHLTVRTTGRRFGPVLVATVVALTVAVTRVALAVHWVSDVALGTLVGVAALGVSVLVLDRVGVAPADGPGPVSSVSWPPLLRETAWWRGRWAWALPAAAAVFDVSSILVQPPARRLGDLLVYHGTAGTVARGADLYEFKTVFGLPFTYPPFAALLAEPLARIPLGLVQTGWTVASLGAAVVVTATVLRPVVERLGAPLTLTAVLLCSPVRSHLSFGQVGLFLVALVGLDLVAARSGGRWRGWGTGVAIAVKLTPAVLVPWLAVVDRGRAWRTVAVATGCTAVGLLLIWPSAPDYLTRAAFDSGRFGRNEIPGNQSIRGMLLRLDLTDRAVTVVWFLAALVLGVVGVRNAVRLERAGNRLAAVGVMVSVSVAVSPISWVHHLVWLAFPLAALVAAGRTRLAAAWWLVLVVTFPYLVPRAARSLPALDPLWQVLVDIQGLTAVAAVFLLPALVQRAQFTQVATSGRASRRSGAIGPPQVTHRP